MKSIILVAFCLALLPLKSFAGPKTWTNDIVTQECTLDLKAKGAIGTQKICDLPDNFVVTDVVAYVVEAPVTADSATAVVGEDGAGDADGYFTNIAALTNVVKGTGALVTGGKAHKVDPTKDGVLVTVAVGTFTAGKILFNFIGYQGK